MKKAITVCFLFAGCQFLVMILFSTEAPAQSIQTARYEREQKNSDHEFILLSMKEEGILLIRDNEKFREGKQLWEITRLDTSLQEVWTMEIDLDNRLHLVGYEYKDQLLYLLFRIGEHDAGELSLLTVQTNSKQISRHTIKQEISFRLTHFSALANSIALGGYVSKEPAILLYNLESEKAKIVPGFFVSDNELLDLRVNTNNTFNTVIVDRTNKQTKKLTLKTFDATGALLVEDNISIDPKRTILSAITSTLLNDELLVVGTWTEGNSKQASGIYATLIDPFSDQSITYYDFGQLEHFLDYATEKRAANIKSKSLQASKAGEIPDFKTYAIPVRLEEQPQGFALLTEVYFPSTNLSTYPYWSNYYGAMPYSAYSPFGLSPFVHRYYNTPYQVNSPQTGETKMIHASLMTFDLHGKVLHDYGLNLDDKKTAGLEQTSDFIFYGNYMALAYKKEKEVQVSRFLEDGRIQSDTVATRLQNETEIIRNESTDNGSVRFWYKSNLYVWGYQNIKDKSQKMEDSTRYVFYINKIEIR